MNPRHILTLLLALILASPAVAETSGSNIFGSSTDFQGVLEFTALDPGATSSSVGVFSSYSQAPTSDYTYLYYLQNDSEPSLSSGEPFCEARCFYGLDLDTLIDPTGSGIHTIGYDTINGGEEPSDAYGTSPDLISFEFDLDPNYGILPDGGFSAILRFFSPFGPSTQGGAWITNNTGDVDDFIHITNGVVTPVPEPGTAALLGLGLVAMGLRRRA